MGLDIAFLAVLKEIPPWFHLATGGIQILGIIVSFLISYLAYRAYKLTKEEKYRYFFYGFLFLGLSFLVNLAFNIILRLGYVKYFVEKRYELFIAPLFLIYYFFFIGVLLAYVSFAIVYAEIKKTNKIWLFYFWTFVIGIYTFRDLILFNMFAAILLSFVVLLTYEKYKQSKNTNKLFTFLAFSSLFLFHVLVLFQSQIAALIVIRYVILLIGLVLLAFTLLKIYGRKKK